MKTETTVPVSPLPYGVLIVGEGRPTRAPRGSPSSRESPHRGTVHRVKPVVTPLRQSGPECVDPSFNSLYKNSTFTLNPPASPPPLQVVR